MGDEPRDESAPTATDGDSDRPTGDDARASASATAGRDRSTTGNAFGWWLALFSPLVVPWVVVTTTARTLVFPWGMTTPATGSLTTLPAYVGATSSLPTHLEMWPLAVVCYVLGVVWAGGARYGADRRVTAGLFVLAAIAIAWLASGLGVGPQRQAIPLGSIHLLALATWAYVRA